MRKNLTKKEKEALSEFKQRLLRKFGKDLLELKLFGSKARGDFHKESDIDVLIVLKSLSKRKKDFILDLALKLLYKYGVDVSPHIYSQKRYLEELNLPSVFMQILKREAIPL